MTPPYTLVLFFSYLIKNNLTIYLLILVLGHLHAENDTRAMSFHELILIHQDIERLKENDQQHINIRGFLYFTPEGHHILSSQPNLRSCCVALQTQIDQRIRVYGLEQPPITTQPLKLEGILKVYPEYNKEEKMIGLYTLENAHIIPEKPRSSIFKWIVFLSICVASVVYFSRSSHKKPQRTERV